jgi:hypothetical protein
MALAMVNVLWSRHKAKLWSTPSQGPKQVSYTLQFLVSKTRIKVEIQIHKKEMDPDSMKLDHQHYFQKSYGSFHYEL